MIGKDIVLSGKGMHGAKITAPRLWFVFAVLLLFCAAGAGTAAADTVTADSLEELAGAITNASGTNSTRTIVIRDDIFIGSAGWLPVIGSGQDITLTPEADTDQSIFRTSSTGILITVATGGSLTITGNGTGTLTVDGNNVPGTTWSLISVDGGTFVMEDGIITNNTAADGGGVIVKGGTFTMSGGAIINNTGKDGGGVYVKSGTFTMSGGAITNNTAPNLGGGVHIDDGRFTMTGGEIAGNTASGTGGVSIYTGSTFTMSGGTIAGNTATGHNGGIQIHRNSRFTMSGGSITGNTAKGAAGAGGIYTGSTFTMSGGTISGNTAMNGHGGGICVAATSAFTMSGGEVINNSASGSGGGVYSYGGGTFTMSDGMITNNTGGFGGGVYANSGGTFTMSGGTIADNLARSDTGGGVIVYSGSRFNMSGGTITGNTAADVGGGVSVYSSGVFTMSAGTISNNTGNYGGGGVYAVVGGTFNMSGGEITGNSGSSTGGSGASGDGGGVFVFYGMFTMSGGEISGNSATNAGGVIVHNGTFMMSSDASITNNTADYYGGGVYVTTSGAFTMSDDAKVTGNSARDGDGVYVGTGSAFTMAGSASVDAENEVYLDSNTFISVTSPLTAGGAQNITHADKAVGTKVIQLPAGAADDDYKNFFDLSASKMPPFVLKYNDSSSLPAPIYELALGYTITVLDNGRGTGFALPKAALEGTEITLTAVPNPGCTFSNWEVVNGSITITGGKFLMPAENVTVRAVFTANTVSTTPTPVPTGGGNTEDTFRVLFETFGGSYVPPITGLSYGDRITKPADPTKDGYTFGGWYKDETCTIPWMFAVDAVPGDMTLYAKWIGGAAPTATVTVSPTMTATGQPVTTSPTGTGTTVPTSGTTGDGKPDGSGIYNSAIFFLLLLFFIFLLLILLLRHTVTFLVTTAEGARKYRVKVWHGKRIKTDDLPEFIITSDWYIDEEREDRWDLTEERVTKSIRLYPGN